MELQVIKCSDGYFIKGAKDMRFGEEYVKPTWKSDWVKSSQITGTAYKVTPKTQYIAGYSLKEGYIANEIMPSKVAPDFFNYSYESDTTSYSDIRPLYDFIYEEVEEKLEPIEVTFKVIAEVEGSIVEQKLNIPVYGTYKSEGKRYSITNYNVKVGLLDEVAYPDLIHQELPCELSSEDSYKIIRTYVKDNIDPKVAKITSDYDFCFTVEKKIKLSEKEAYTKDLNFTPFGKKRKPNIVTDYRTDRHVKIYETAPKRSGEVYKGYTETPSFKGNNLEDLKNNIESFLKELITKINRPLVDCPNCKGLGVIEA